MLLKRIIYYALFLFTLTACKGSKKLTDSSSKMNAESVRMALIKNQVKADWLNANVKLYIDGGGISQGASATIKMKKDSIIWVSVRKLGFEIARAQVTKDSVYVLDRFNRQYLVNDLDFLSEEYQLPANLETLQAIFLGNPIFFTSSALQLEEQDDQYRLYNTGNQRGDYWLDKENLLLREMQLQNSADQQRLKIQLADYQPISANHLFSYDRKLFVDSEDTGNVEITMEFQKVEINSPQSLRFDVPNNYKKIE